MKICRHSFIYEQVEENKLVACKLPKGECLYQEESFNSSADSKRYIVCNEKGLTEKTTEKEHWEKERKGFRQIGKMTDDLTEKISISENILLGKRKGIIETI